MKIGIMGWDYEEYESIQLFEVSKSLGHEVYFFTLNQINLSLINGKSLFYAGGVLLNELDIIISRAQIREGFWKSDTELLNLLKVLDVTFVDNITGFINSESKALTLQTLALHGYDVPDTIQCFSVQGVKDVFKKYDEVVVKPSYGYAGVDIEKLDDRNSSLEINSIITNLLNKYGNILVQPYIPHPEGDIRTTVIGNKVEFSLRRIPNNKTWKANVALGADLIEYEPPQKLIEISIKVANILGLDIAGLDILPVGDKFYILEVNNVPGWYPFPEEKGMGICEKIISYAVQKHKGRCY